MLRYFMHLRDSDSEVLDPDGCDFESLAELRIAVLNCARDCLMNDLRSGVLNLRYRIDAEDGGGALIHTLPFKDAFTLILETP
jgi:hypothetical protein